MARTKLEGESWPRAWIDGKPSDDWAANDLTKIVEDEETFHLGQVYENTAAQAVECAECGGREFNVGSGSYFTVLRCPKCAWEICFHDG